MSSEYPITFPSDGQQVVGMWHAPAGGPPAPALVLCHGFTGHKAESHRLFVDAARAFAGRGIGVLRFDFRGSGDSEGESVDVTVSAQVADARAALAYVRARPEVDPARIGILGLSMGGLVVALMAGDEPALRAIALWNPLANPSGVAERRRKPETGSQLEQWGYADHNGWAVGIPFLTELPRLKPLESIVRHAIPVLVVLGDQDESVPNEEGRAYEHALREADREVHMHVVQGGGHTFDSLPAKREAIDHTLQWFLPRL